ncbi:MAG: kynureninase [Frankiales bacterium]|nr:kynureninase [Frankiales bacterium]
MSSEARPVPSASRPALRAAAEVADQTDPIAFARQRFTLPAGVIYLDGNSLGAMPAAVPAAMADALARQWGADLITSWNGNGWWQLPASVGAQIGALLGAGAGQVLCGDSTSVQLFQALTAAARARPGRDVLITDGSSFPTDQYIADSVGRLLGLEVRRIEPDQLGAALDERTAAVSFSLVDYRTGELLDGEAITAAVHRAGAVMVWDLCHAAGALPVALDAWQVDLAVGCGYKYFNGGPGAPAFIYVAEGFRAGLDLPLTGWHGHQSPFALEQRYQPAATIERARIGTPPVLSMLALQAALTAFDGVSIAALRRKSLALTEQIIAYADERLARYDVRVRTPRAPERRGSQVALQLPHALEVSQALIARGVIGDFRAPDLLRLGVAPLYLRHVDVLEAMQALEDVLASGAHLAPEFAQRPAVT